MLVAGLRGSPKWFISLCTVVSDGVHVSAGIVTSVRSTTCTPSTSKTPCSPSTLRTSPRTSASLGRFAWRDCPPLTSVLDAAVWIWQWCSRNVSLSGWESRPYQQPDQEFALHSHQEWEEGQSHRYRGLTLYFVINQSKQLEYRSRPSYDQLVVADWAFCWLFLKGPMHNQARHLNLKMGSYNRTPFQSGFVAFRLSMQLEIVWRQNFKSFGVQKRC